MRETGYYWVKTKNDEWIVAHWVADYPHFPDSWYIPGWEVPESDDKFAVITLTPLEPPK